MRAVGLIVLDSVGIGGAPDADRFGDAGAATLQHVAAAVGGLHVPNLAALGLGRVVDAVGIEKVERPAGAYGAMVERSPGKDTTTGHWEMMGVVLDRAFPTFPDGFPNEVIEEFQRRTGVEVLGNVAASGTEIIERLGEEHVASGNPIVYTSADSVFQIAAHTDVIPLDRLYELCRVARALLTGEHRVGRVIARPFDGAPGAFRRTADRHDFSVPPPRTVLDALVDAGKEVRAVGKISDIFAGRGITSSTPTGSNDEGMDVFVRELEAIEEGLVFVNLVDFDQAYGHRNDPQGYGRALEAFDARLPESIAALGRGDVLIITADHGNDPTTTSTDHSRERVPLLVAAEAVAAGADIGERDTFADCGATIADLLGVEWTGAGGSFRRHLLRDS